MSADTAKEPRRGLIQSLAVFGERRALVMLALGFASGLPNLLIFDTLSLWLREAGLSLQVISIFALATLSYSLKFLWAPLVDRTAVPGLTRALGHRRSWMLVLQGALMVGLWAISGVDPARVIRILTLSLGSTVILLVLTGLFAAAVAQVSSYGVIPLVLAYSPGGLAEMSLVALALQIEVAFVAAHHIVRVFFVMMGAGPAFALLRRWT